MKVSRLIEILKCSSPEADVMLVGPDNEPWMLDHVQKPEDGKVVMLDTEEVKEWFAEISFQ